MSTTIELPPCKHGHDAKYRFINNRGQKACRTCMYEAFRKWERANWTHRRRYHRLYGYVRRGLLDETGIIGKRTESQ